MGPGMNCAALPPTIRLVALIASGLPLAVACSPEPPPRTVIDFVENPRLLEATMVRCAENRAELKYTPECLNAREAVDRLAARDEVERRKELEAQSARKREALRRAQQAAAQARARAEEAERQRREAEYLAQFGEPESPYAEPQPAQAGSGQAPAATGQPGDAASGAAAAGDGAPTTVPAPSVTTTPYPAGNPPPSQSPATGTEPTGLDAVREELRRRQEAGQQGSDGQP